MNRTIIVCTQLVCLAAFVGCGSRGPARPGFDPDWSAQEALKIYDANSDGSIDESEVESSPGLREAFANIDTDSDGKLTADEIKARVSYYKTAPTTIISGATRVKFKKRLVIGARVVFEPEPFLGADFKVCQGVTQENGVASVKGVDDEFPGIYLGFYTVRITKDNDGKELFPAKYNEESTLGYEATDDLNIGLADIISFDLK